VSLELDLKPSAKIDDDDEMEIDELVEEDLDV
jgi:hypothetical protein